MSNFRPYKYLKDESFDPMFKSVSKGFFLKSRIMPIFFVSLGLLILISQIVVPLIAFKMFTKVSKPVRSSVLGIASGFRNYEFKELSEEKNFENLGDVNAPEFFYLSIPKLGIQDALIQTNSKDPDPVDYLGHYAGSALPGNAGNTFIYGHSVLPFFYNPKNYKTIFSTLDKLESGDVLSIKYNNRDLMYVVKDLIILSPDEVHPLDEVKPKYLNESTVTLMTCVPPGTKTNRLLVIADLTN